MTTRRDNSRVMSRLPEDGAYWEALTDRLVGDAADRLRMYRSRGAPWWGSLARFSTPLTVGAAAAVIAALIWPTMLGEPARRGSSGTLYGVAPNDPLAAVFVTSAAAPTIATLWAGTTLEGTP